MSLALAAFFMPGWRDCALAQTMALPGEFAVSAAGAASYSIPIAVAPGTAGIAPALALSYDSEAGNGLIGMGWQLEGLSSISRCPRTIATDGVYGGVNFDANDRFCLDGQRLIAISGTDGADGTEYRTEIESFTKVVSRGVAGTGPAWFEVRSKAGQIMEFGNSADSRLLAPGVATARAWAVNKVSDSKGNYFTVSYTNSASQTYPTRIDYTGNAAAGLAPYNSVRFVYQARPDPVPAFLGGTTLQTTVRLSNLQLFTEESLVSDYRFTYAQGTATGRSQLTSITLCGADNKCLPASNFTWQQGNENGGGALSFTQLSPGQAITTDSVGDWNGDGLTDWAKSNASITDFYVNNGFVNGEITSTKYTLPGNGLRYPPLYVGDFNGDGLSDFRAHNSAASAQWWYLNSGITNGALSFTQLSPGQAITTDSVGDWNGDGLTDWAKSNASITDFYVNNGFVNGEITSTKYTLPGNGLRYPPLYVGDFNGDGLSDFRAHNSAASAQWWYLNNNTAPDLLTKIRGGFGATTSITYKPLTAAGVHVKDSGANAAVPPMRDIAGPRWVVTHVDQSDGIGGQRGWDYAYVGAKTDQQGRGFLGFRQRKVTDLRTGIITTSSYRQDFPFAGLLAGEVSTQGPLTLGTVTNSYNAVSLGGTRRRVFLNQSGATRTDLDGTALPSVTSTYQYDDYGNATQVTSTTSDGFSKTTTSTYSNDVTNWLLGRLTKATVTSQTP